VKRKNLSPLGSAEFPLAVLGERKEKNKNGKLRGKRRVFALKDAPPPPCFS
jgi:hypothetical protein